MKIKCRIIGFDLDGTLLNSEKHIAEHTREVLTRAVEQGIWILPVTGRPLGGLPKEVVEFPGVQYAITANGARIMETQTGGCLYERLVPVKTAEQIMEIFSDYDALREVYYGGKGYAEAEEFSRVGEYMRSPQMAVYVRATRTPVPDILQLIREKGQDTDKVQGVFKIDEERTEARKRLEAVEIKLTGDMEKYYDVWYRVHIQHHGWLGWAKNGESAGTEGYSYRLEAIQIQLVKKGSSAPGSTNNCFYKR